MTTVKTGVMVTIVPLLIVGALQVLRADPFAATDPPASAVSSGFRDPGVRAGGPGAGQPFTTLSPSEQDFFNEARGEFEQSEDALEGLGPRFNLDSCVGCHSQPASGGSSPSINPQVAAATFRGALNQLPSFITLNGPVREARFPKNADGTPDGGVHSLFVISGRDDAMSCHAVQENFETQVTAGNIIFRIPTPTFGTGLMEMIPDATIEANRTADGARKTLFGISGRANHNGNDGSIARFGWKAQNKSLLLFAGEAYNVEMGISNELFQTERDEKSNCQYKTVPNATTNMDPLATNAQVISATEQFALFMRFLAPAKQVVPPVAANGDNRLRESILRGEHTFSDAGCALCHTPSLKTGNAATAALAYKQAHLYSDLLIHQMGPKLADGIAQGQAKGNEFRSAPLWGLGKRIFFLHDGRTSDLVEAIRAHRSGGTDANKSEANTSINLFDGLIPVTPGGTDLLNDAARQDLLNFLRSL